MSEELHQGILEYLLLARTMRERFPTLTEVTEHGIVVNTDELFYSGISQGGIFGHTVMALTSDMTYGHLGVPGTNYSLLLYRSIDFTPFFEIIQSTYQRTAQHAIIISTLQLLWDGTDPISYVHHVTTEPFGITEQPYPYTGSGIVMYDFGNPWAPPGNITPPENELGDPHGRPRRQDHHNLQMVTFFRTGEIIDVCGGDGCTPD